MSHFDDSALPKGWRLWPIVSIADPITSTVDKKEHDGERSVRLVNYTDVYYNDEISAGDYMVATASDEQLRKFSVRSHDVAITKDSETSNDIGISAYVPTTLAGHVWGYHLAIYRARDRRYAKFIKWLFDAAPTKADLEIRTPGVTRVGLSQNSLRYLRVPIPEPEIALCIADFLDVETAEIDAFIADQEQLIAMLTERRAATIHDAVTRGLDPNAQLRESGVEWLGQVPISWRIAGLRRFARSFGGAGFPVDLQGVTDAEIPFYKVNALARADEDDVIRFKDETISRETANALRARIFTSGTIVIAKIGAALLLGRVRFLGADACIDNNLLGVQLSSEVSPSFVRYAMTLLAFERIVLPGAVPSLDIDELMAYELAWPSIEEQTKIAGHLDRETSAIDAAIADAREAIALSKERRGALISAAVTGQIDVAVRGDASA